MQHLTAAPSVIETHSAVVFFYGDRVFKAKKPVDLGFLDFTTRESREAACRREVELNRRLAPDVYLGVFDVLDEAGERCDHLVAMRRMPARARLSTLVGAGEDIHERLTDLAHLVAAFHSRAERSPDADSAAGVEATRDRWHTNTAELSQMPWHPEDLRVIEEIAELADRYLEGRADLLSQRVSDGRSCDGHGDLLADDIFFLPDGPRVLDCIDFDDRLRWGDVLADVAFLAMDLERLGRRDLADAWMSSYQRVAGDNWPASLAHHHIAYRAQVRAKVAAIRATQGVEAAAADAQQLLQLCRSRLEAGRVRLVVVGGLPGTGKSTVAAGIGDRLGAVVLRSDEIRKELAGIDTLQPAPDGFQAGIYDPSLTARTYGEMLRRARVALELGSSVVLDASFTDDRWRTEARAVASDTFADASELLCVAPREVAAERMRDRGLGRDASDADPAIAAEMAETADPWPAAITIDTTGTVEQTRARAVEALG